MVRPNPQRKNCYNALDHLEHLPESITVTFDVSKVAARTHNAVAKALECGIAPAMYGEAATILKRIRRTHELPSLVIARKRVYMECAGWVEMAAAARLHWALLYTPTEEDRRYGYADQGDKRTTWWARIGSAYGEPSALIESLVRQAAADEAYQRKCKELHAWWLSRPVLTFSGGI